MLTSSMFAPLRTWSQRHVDGGLDSRPTRSAAGTSREPVTFWRSPIITNPVSGRISNGSRPLNVGTRSSKVGDLARAARP